eukprot:SAG31_NODE_1099_length_9914_cov_6.721345_1_plen_83_part_00
MITDDKSYSCVRLGGEFGKFHEAFLSAIDVWSYLDSDHDGVLVLSDIEPTLSALKIQDIVTLEKLRKLDPNNVRRLTSPPIA